jgi:hypothetical protein
MLAEPLDVRVEKTGLVRNLRLGVFLAAGALALDQAAPPPLTTLPPDDLVLGQVQLLDRLLRNVKK